MYRSDNKLINGYGRTQLRPQFTGNPLLASGRYTNNIEMQQQMNRLKEAQRMRELDSRRQPIQDPTQIKNIILGIKKVDDKLSKSEFDQKVSGIEIKYGDRKEKEKLWEKRTNQPYKNVLHGIELKKEYRDKDDLIVYRVTKADKDEKKLEKDLKEFDGKITEHNKELKGIYTQDKKDECKMKFEYNNVYKYAVKYDPSDGNKLKDDVIDYYKKEQQEIERDKQTVDDIISAMVTTGVINDEQAKELEKTDITQLKKEINEEIHDDTDDKDDKIVKADKYRSRQKKTVI